MTSSPAQSAESVVSSESVETTLFVASRGASPEHGLVRADLRDGAWRLRTLATADQLSALAWHPTLPVVYGTAGVNRTGQLLAWRVGDGAELLADEVAGPEELEPCHVAVDPTGGTVVVTNYTSGQLALWRLAEDGTPLPDPLRIQLEGSGPETARQDAAHPHQAVFDPATGQMYVIDLGADLVRSFEVDLSDPATVSAREVATGAVPPGTGPRHAVVLPDGRLAVSGELGSTLVVGRPGSDEWAVAASTTRTGPARTRHERNYPGDLQLSADGRYVYFANRGYDTISVLDVSGAEPVLVVERDAVVRWPQHIHVRENDILVAGWDSSQIVRLPLVDGVAGEAEELLVVDSPGWILPTHPALG